MIENYLETVGKEKGTKYMLSAAFLPLSPIHLVTYYEKKIDEGDIYEEFHFSIINEVLVNYCVFTDPGLKKMTAKAQKSQRKHK